MNKVKFVVAALMLLLTVRAGTCRLEGIWCYGGRRVKQTLSTQI